MQNRFALTAVVAAALAVSGCSKAPAPATSPPAATGPSVGAPVEDAGEEVTSGPAVDLVDRIPMTGRFEDLEGTVWQVGDLVVRFQAGGHLLVQGNTLEDIAPGGSPGRSHVRDGVLELEILGRHYLCTWDGTVLTVAGRAGIRIAESGGSKEGGGPAGDSAEKGDV